jgi:hypothetical protein
MDGYSFNILKDVLLMYGRADFNGLVATQLFREHFPDRCQQNHETFAAFDG